MSITLLVVALPFPEYGGYSYLLWRKCIDTDSRSDRCDQVVKTQGAETWAGTTMFFEIIQNEEGLQSFKSGKGNRSQYYFNGWQTLVFDFDQQAPGTEPLSTEAGVYRKRTSKIGGIIGKILGLNLISIQIQQILTGKLIEVIEK